MNVRETAPTYVVYRERGVKEKAKRKRKKPDDAHAGRQSDDTCEMDWLM